MGTKGFLAYLLSAFSVAILSAFFIDQKSTNPESQIHYLNSVLQYTNESLNTQIDGPDSYTKVWPELEFNWRIVLATLIGFMGSAFGTVGGVGGGGIFVPMLNLVVGFDTKSAAALSKCMIMGASASSVWFNLRIPHPLRDVPILDYDLALLFQPMLLLGITIGVSLSVVFPYWLITVLIIILFLGTSSRSFFKGIEMWKMETASKNELEYGETVSVTNGEVVINADYEPLIPRKEKSGMEILLFNIRWKRLLALVLVWFAFLLLQLFKNDTVSCSPLYWVLNILQFPVALSLFLYGAMKLHRRCKEKQSNGTREAVCEATIEWSLLHISLCAACGIIGGTVGGLLGSGGGFVLGPLLLEIGVIPQVASATATFVMMFSASLSVLEFYFLKRFPIPFALYLIAVSVIAGFWGQYLVRKLVTVLKRASIIVFILSGVIFFSALVMGVVGIKTTIQMISDHEYMGFLSICQ